MTDYISSSIIESESDGGQSPATSSTFGSFNDTSLPSDKMEQLIRKLRSENKSLQLRVLGVNELARLLQDRSEKVKVLEDKNKRLEVAVVRLENRCANLEQKLRDGSGTAGPRSMQPPSIPGPSRQILEALMKENSELKKALNNMQKKGVSGYLEAVKTTQLEEVIEQQKQDLDFLRAQVNTLTTTPLPTSSGPGTEEELSGDSAIASVSQNTSATGSPGTLRRQLIKMQHALKVKDRFCSLLSDQVASLQDQVKRMTLDETPEPEETSTSGRALQETEPTDILHVVDTPTGEHPQITSLKDQLRDQKQEMEDLKDTLQKEREEHVNVVEKFQKSEEDVRRLAREKDGLEKRVEDLQFHNHTLLDDKKQLQETIDQMKAAGAKVAEGGGLERELRELQDSLNQKVMEHSEELRNKEKEMQQLRMMLEDTQYKYVIADSKLSEIEKEHEQNITDLKDKLDYKEIDASSKQSEIESLKLKVRHLEMEISSLRSKPSPVPVAYREIVSRDTISQSVPPLLIPPTMQYMEAVKDGREPSTYSDPTVRPAHSHWERCDTTPRPETIIRPELLARDPDQEPHATGSQQPQAHPSSLPFHSTKPPPRHPSPSPSSAATPHQMPPHVIPGRRSPHQHYPIPPATTPYLGTPMGYPPSRHTLPPQHFDPSMGHPQQTQYPPYGQPGMRGSAPPGPSHPPTGRGTRPPDGHHHDPSHHHQHHTPRRD